jgi:hypothetical protein
MPRKLSVKKPSLIRGDNQIRQLPATIGGLYLLRRFHVDPQIADLVALHAGLGLQEARQ